MNTLLIDPVAFFWELGGLHDADIQHLTWSAVARTITLGVDDLNANFDGLPEYSGKRQASIIFVNAENIFLRCDAVKAETQRIYKLAIQKKEGVEKYELILRISPSGDLSFDCESVNIVDINAQ